MTINQVVKTYNPFISQIFTYLKSNILNKFYNIRIDISYDPEYSAEAGNTVSARNLFYKIVLYMYAFDNNIDNIIYTKNRILWVLVHESYHQNQMYDINKYNGDRDYRNYIECNVDCAAITFINEHERELSSILGIPIYTYDLDKIRRIHNSPKITVRVTEDNLDVKTFISLISYYFTMSTNVLYNLYNSKDDIIIDFIKNGKNNPIYLKYKGIMNYDNINYIMWNCMSQGILDLIYHNNISTNKDNVYISIYLKNELIKVMGRV